ncbi:unnamed protein product [Dicrocoelium dendriticum]|nr:unnamed protein product [Dicrocoelium dendriticum]
MDATASQHVMKLRETKRYYQQLASIKPKLENLSLSDVYTLSWSELTCTQVNDAAPESEYQSAYRTVLNLKPAKRMPTCNLGSPIAVLNQDLSRLPTYSNLTPSTTTTAGN